jgi:hypothetical protein
VSVALLLGLGAAVGVQAWRGRPSIETRTEKTIWERDEDQVEGRDL